MEECSNGFARRVAILPLNVQRIASAALSPHKTATDFSNSNSLSTVINGYRHLHCPFTSIHIYTIATLTNYRDHAWVSVSQGSRQDVHTQKKLRLSTNVRVTPPLRPFTAARSIGIARCYYVRSHLCVNRHQWTATEHREWAPVDGELHVLAKRIQWLLYKARHT
jgi:hypothetical protein